MDGSVDDSVGQGVFLLEEDAKEYGIGAAVVHFGQFGDGGGWMQHRDRTAGHHRSYNDRFSQRARSTLKRATIEWNELTGTCWNGNYFAERQEESFEEGARLEEGFA